MSPLVRKFHAFNKTILTQFTLGFFIFGGMLASIVLASKPQDIRQQASTGELNTLDYDNGTVHSKFTTNVTFDKTFSPTYTPDPSMACNNVYYVGQPQYFETAINYLKSYGWGNFYRYGNPPAGNNWPTGYADFPDPVALNLGPKDLILVRKLHTGWNEDLVPVWSRIQAAADRGVKLVFLNECLYFMDTGGFNLANTTFTNLGTNIRMNPIMFDQPYLTFSPQYLLPLQYPQPSDGYVTDALTHQKHMAHFCTGMYQIDASQEVRPLYVSFDNGLPTVVEQTLPSGSIVRAMADTSNTRLDDIESWSDYPDDQYELMAKLLSCSENAVLTPTQTPSDTPSFTPISTPSITSSSTPTLTPTNTPTKTPSSTPSKSPTPTRTPTPTATPVPVSCNFYSAGNFADVLAGYTDPAVKILKQLGAINKGKYFGFANKSAFNAKDLSDANFLVYFTFSSSQKMDKVSNQVNTFLNQGKHVLLVTDGTEGSTGQYTSGANQYLLPIGRRYAGNTSFGLFNISETTLTNPKLRGLRQMYLTSASKVTDTTASGTNTFPPVKKYTCQYTMSTNPNWCLWGEIEFTNGARLDLLTSAASVGGGADPSAQPLGTQLLGKYVSQTCSATCGNHICEVGESAPCPSGAQCVWTGSCPSDCGGR